MTHLHRKIPATMVSQHPDNAFRPYWHHQAFIRTQDEVEECFRTFSELNVSEYKWDWEGKLVDESVIERLLNEHLDYFKKHELGKDKFITFRLPNPKVQTESRLGRAFMNIISAANLVKIAGYTHPALFEVILPMTETAEEIFAIEEAFDELLSLKHPLLKIDKEFLTGIRMIPLFEQVEVIMDSDKILERYINLHSKKFNRKIPYMRPYVARSDPALNAGVIPTVLAIKVALSNYKELEKKLNIPMHPIIGSASLVFRGGLNPDTVNNFINEYKGVRTSLLQSAFRYDFPQKKVRQAIETLEEKLPQMEAVTVSRKDEERIRSLIPLFSNYYQKTVELIAPLINEVANQNPRRRERIQHIGLFGYSRGVGKVRLPRAIGFTSAMYSIGVPPELIATGRGLHEVQKQKLLPLIEKYYLNMQFDLERAGRFLNKEILNYLAKKDFAWQKIQQDVQAVEEYLGKKLGPQTKEEKKHYETVDKLYKALQKKKPIKKYIEQTGKLRRSLG